MANPPYRFLRQIPVWPGPGCGHVVTDFHAEKRFYIHEQEKYENFLLQRCPPNLWPGEAHKTTCPRPILIHEAYQQHLQHLQDLHEALIAAITDVVER